VENDLLSPDVRQVLPRQTPLDRFQEDFSRQPQPQLPAKAAGSLLTRAAIADSPFGGLVAYRQGLILLSLESGLMNCQRLTQIL